ncbi:MAG: hypothetical protein U0903_02405 [Planctomycetales bacterium]
MLRIILSVVVGVVTAIVLLIAVEGFSAVVHPFPEGFQGTREEICRHVEKYPAWILEVVIPMWAGIGFLSTWVTARIGNLYSGIFVGVQFLAAVIVNVVMLPYPLWFKAGMPLATFIAIVLAVRLTLRRKVAVRPASAP